jgi:putative oxidoreductase
MKQFNTLGRIFLAIPFVLFGINHFIIYDIFLGMLSSFVPNSVYLIFLTGALLIIAGIGIILNRQVMVFCYILAGLLCLFILTIHLPVMFTADAETARLSLFAFLKDLGLLGGLMMIISSSKSNVKSE